MSLFHKNDNISYLWDEDESHGEEATHDDCKGNEGKSCISLTADHQGNRSCYETQYL